MAVFPQRVFYVAAELRGCRYEIVDKKSGATEKLRIQKRARASQERSKRKERANSPLFGYREFPTA
jgi:hypothetical protein